ncbi:hypothetical protein [Laspinema olomoucense]|nr:hypothetical protein [Laspinema sp. D3d]MCT7974540.1 hypothetical protein [Laspinema sp. D3d]
MWSNFHRFAPILAYSFGYARVGGGSTAADGLSSPSRRSQSALRVEL